ncbi:MAG TPA: ATP-binding protein [Candidatus Sulfotelmatobacter sp.]|jgi:two-component system NtrC family sensor kinase|nr:ATP-binding protein [Candidatus Sulfotelmatobacter sp.]
MPASGWMRREIVGKIVEDKERLESEMAGLLNSIDSGVLLLDTEYRVLRASDRLAAIFGIESRRLLEFGTVHALIDGLAHQFLRPAETATRWREHLRQGNQASSDEFEIVRPTRRIVERFTRPLHRADGTQLGWLETFRDITGERLIQSKLLQTEKMASLGQLVSGIAHELNNPLTSIQGYAQLLLGRRSGPDRAADALRISQEAERAGRIVKNLLLFSREAKSERRAVRLNEVVERTLALRAYELKLENVDVDLVLDPGLPTTLGDAAQLQQAVLNLIVNAEQAIVMTREGDARGGRILIRTERLAGDRLALRVSDDGPGIPPEIAPRIFDPFFTTKPPGIGTGLGLSIVYGIVREHGGEISVDSPPAHGATVSIELPALAASGLDFARDDGPERRAARVVPLTVVERPTTKERILVVEDEPTVAELIADVMADEGYEVETLLDSREALGRFQEVNYSLVICDLKMPYLDGPGLYRALVRRENPIRHKLLFVTGDTMAPRTIEFLKSSGLPYLAKPFLVEELKEAVSNALATVHGGERSAAGLNRSRVAGRES